MSGRVHAVDVARGLLMLYIVVLVHGVFWLNIWPERQASALLFEMPLIFIISGYAVGLGQVAMHARDAAMPSLAGYVRFVVARYSRILIPYGLYALCCAALMYALWGHAHQPAWSWWRVLIDWLNPLVRGAHYSHGKLAGHLWFVPIFLVVMAALPLALVLRPARRMPAWGVFVWMAVVMALLTWVPSPLGGALRYTAFYLFWAWLGGHLCTRAWAPSFSDCVLIALLSLTGLALVGAHAPDTQVLNMQRNKFPPNAVFFLFSSFWVALWLGVAQLVRRQPMLIAWLARQFWLKPFMSAGYSIYLWQGLAYTAAMDLGERLQLPMVAVWLLAVVGAVGLGWCFRRAEGLRVHARAAGGEGKANTRMETRVKQRP